MSWLRLDDAMVGHRKTRRLLKGHRAGAGLASFGLHTLALLHCAQYLTDGFVEQEFIDETFDDANVRGKQRAQLVQALVDGGQWESGAGGYMIHDYLKHNPSRAVVEAKRAKDAARKAAGRDAQSKGSPNGVQAESARTDAGVRTESDGPVPTRPTPVPELPPDPPAGGRKRDREPFEEEMGAWCRGILERFPDLSTILPDDGVPERHVRLAADRLRTARKDVTPELVRDRLVDQYAEAAA